MRTAEAKVKGTGRLVVTPPRWMVSSKEGRTGCRPAGAHAWGAAAGGGQWSGAGSARCDGGMRQVAEERANCVLRVAARASPKSQIM